MQTQGRVNEYARLNAFHGPKRQLLGNHAGQAAPAWRTNGVLPAQAAGIKGKAPAESGSRIFLSKLPVDVGEKEVEVSARGSMSILDLIVSLNFAGAFQ